MWIGDYPPSCLFRSNTARPNLRPTEEETLLGRETIDQLIRLSCLRLLKRTIGQCQPTKIRDTFSDNQFTLKVQARFCFESIKLFYHAIRPLTKALIIALSPPIFEITRGVEACTLVVEPVGHLVSNNRTHSSVVDRIIGKDRRTAAA